MSLTRDDYATLEVRAAIFHDLPRQSSRNGDAAVLLLSEAATTLDESGRAHIRSKLVDTLQSPKSYPVQFSTEDTVVSASAREYLNQVRYNEADFIRRSRAYAEALFELQGPPMSAGLLCVVACTVNARRALGLMKIEREEGAQLRLSGADGARTFTFALLNNLVFTKNTKLFKAGLFAKIGPDADSFGAAASDHQFGNNMAQYWLEFLGCEKEREARVETKLFFETIVHEINKASDLTPIEKHDAYEALLVEMRSRRGAVNVSQFVREHIPEAAQDDVRAKLREAGVANHFDKNTVDIKSSITRKVLRTANDIHVIVPQAFDNLVDVTEESLTVRDPVVRIGRD